jgi:hypothetical protein
MKNKLIAGIMFITREHTTFSLILIGRINSFHPEVDNYNHKYCFVGSTISYNVWLYPSRKQGLKLYSGQWK